MLKAKVSVLLSSLVPTVLEQQLLITAQCLTLACPDCRVLCQMEPDTPNCASVFLYQTAFRGHNGGKKSSSEHMVAS